MPGTARGAQIYSVNVLTDIKLRSDDNGSSVRVVPGQGRLHSVKRSAPSLRSCRVCACRSCGVTAADEPPNRPVRCAATDLASALDGSVACSTRRIAATASIPPAANRLITGRAMTRHADDHMG